MVTAVGAGMSLKSALSAGFLQSLKSTHFISRITDRTAGFDACACRESTLSEPFHSINDYLGGQRVCD
jgi:hypothetical protein